MTPELQYFVRDQHQVQLLETYHHRGVAYRILSCVRSEDSLQPKFPFIQLRHWARTNRIREFGLAERIKTCQCLLHPAAFDVPSNKSLFPGALFWAKSATVAWRGATARVIQPTTTSLEKNKSDGTAAISLRVSCARYSSSKPPTPSD